MSTRTMGPLLLLLSVLALGCQGKSDHPWENRVARADLPAKGPGPCWEITFDRLHLKPKCEGPVKASFAIVRHFDVRRTYDFGESVQPLQISEERPWRERNFIEVDWSRNLEATSLGSSPRTVAVGLLGLLGVGAGILWSRRLR